MAEFKKYLIQNQTVGYYRFAVFNGSITAAAADAYRLWKQVSFIQSINKACLINNITCGSSEVRNATLDKLVELLYITGVEANNLKKQFINTINGNVTEGVLVTDYQYSTTDDVLTFNINKPIKLSRLFINANDNPDNHDLYLLVQSLKNGSYALDLNSSINIAKYTSGDLINNTVSDGCVTCVNIPSVRSSKNETLTSFIAFKVTERSGDGDIKIDHVDKIRYIDSLTIKVKLPKQYS